MCAVETMRCGLWDPVQGHPAEVGEIGISYPPLLFLSLPEGSQFFLFFAASPTLEGLSDKGNLGSRDLQDLGGPPMSPQEGEFAEASQTYRSANP